MALIGVGGDTSVMWRVDADSARPGTVHSEKDPKEGKPNKYRQSGVDETPDDELQFFTVSIAVPKGADPRRAFADALQAAADSVRKSSNGRISFTLPIEDDKHQGPNHEQIRVSWVSR